jgi:hypothetical protein
VSIHERAPQRWIWLFCLTVTVIALGACGGGGGGGGGVIAPTITATLPANGAVGVAVDTQIRITFSRAMNPVTTEAAMASLPVVAAACVWNGPDTIITCTPAADLAFDTLHTFTIDVGATSAQGANLATAFEFSFTTVAGGAPPGAPACVLGGPSVLGTCKLGT